MRLGRRHDRPGDVLVKIGTADAAVGYADDDLICARLERGLHFLDPEVARGVEAQRAHPLRHDPPRAQAREKVGERRLGIAYAEEAEPAAAAHVGEGLDRPAEIRVCVPPRGETLYREVA